MRSATRRGLTTAIALLTSLVAVLWVASPAQAHDGVNVKLQTDGAGAVWGIVTYVDGHAVSGPITAVFLAASPDGTERVGPIALRAPDGQTDGVVRYGDTLSPGEWQVTFDVASPGIASCAMKVTVVAAGSGPPTPHEQNCAASFWPTASADSGSGGNTSLIVAVVVVGAVLLAVALWIAMRSRRDRPGGGGSRGSGGGPSGPRERTGAARSRTR